MSLPSFQVALELHIRVLWGLVNQGSLPIAVTNIERTNYDARFSSVKVIKADVTAALNNHSADINKARDAMMMLHNKIRNEHGTIANNMRRIPEPHLLMMFRTVATYGLRQWNPDILSGDPDSMYNVLHETIALLTFEQAAAAYAYSFTGLTMNHVYDYTILKKFYRNFVFVYMRSNARLENRKPGERRNILKNSVVWKRRKQVCPFF